MRSRLSPFPLRHHAGHDPEQVERGPALLATRYSLPATSTTPALPVRRRPGEGGSKRGASNGFTLVEVMMAAVILLVGFIGMIEAVVIGAGMMDNARRQTLAAQILSHHAEKLRLLPWDVTTAAPNELSINDLTAASTAVAIDPQFATAIAASGATFTLTRTTATVVSGSLREATFTITWVVNTSRRDALGNPLSFTYSRTLPAYYGKYGLNLSYQRS